MKNKIKYSFLALALAAAFSACNSNKTGERVSDSIDSVTDSLKNDTSSYDITSQRDSTDTAGTADTSASK